MDDWLETYWDVQEQRRELKRQAKRILNEED